MVAEMTGYPAELLDPDLDLEADLGVDTVKQAEVFAAMRKYGVERDENLQLRDFPTLRTWSAGSADAPVSTRRPLRPMRRRRSRGSRLRRAGVDEVLAQVTAVVAEMTGYPAEMLDPDLDLEADLGVDTVKQAEVFAAVRERYGVERDENLQLRDFPTLSMWSGGSADAPVSTRRHPAAAPLRRRAAPAAAAPRPRPVWMMVLAQVSAVVAEMTGYPAGAVGSGSGSGGGSGGGHGEAGGGVRGGAGALRGRA